MATGAPGVAEVSLSDTKDKVVEALPADPVRESILKLRAEQAKVKAQKKALALQVRNEQRKQKRLRKRARQMTDEDLVAVLMMRKQSTGKKQNTEADEQPTSASSNSSSASSSTPAVPLEDAPEARSPTATTG